MLTTPLTVVSCGGNLLAVLHPSFPSIQLDDHQFIVKDPIRFPTKVMERRALSLSRLSMNGVSTKPTFSSVFSLDKRFCVSQRNIASVSRMLLWLSGRPESPDDYHLP